MDNKLLTISIAAYNAESYIRKTLDSLIISEGMEKLEVFIIDDGGSDRTLEIAKEYQKKYPDTFIPVHKENGGYGTTVNYSIEHATGKYFKLLDGDDWFNTDNFEQLLKILQEEESDVIVTNYCQGYDDDHMSPVITHSQAEGTVINLLDQKNVDVPFAMWELVYKTKLIRQTEMELPSHVLYTDRYYFTMPFAYVNTVRYTDLIVYCYRIGRDGQSMSLESQFNHLSERMEGMADLCEFYANQKKMKNPRCKYLLRRIGLTHVITARVIRFMPKSKKNLETLKTYEKKVHEIAPDIINYEWKTGKFGKYLTVLRRTNYLLYWATPDRILKWKA